MTTDLLGLSVPGSVLLFGEYALLEPRGHGLACAVARRLSLTAERADDLECIGIFGGSTTLVYRHNETDHPDTLIAQPDCVVPAPSISVADWGPDRYRQ